MARHPATASCYLDISANYLDLAKVSRLLRLRPTHWYSPRKIEPKTFGIARATAIPKHRYCWQLRTRFIASNLPSAGLDRIVQRLSGREESIQEIRKKYRADVALCVYVDSNDDISPSVWVTAKAVRFAAAVGAHLEVELLSPSPKKSPVSRSTRSRAVKEPRP